MAVFEKPKCGKTFVGLPNVVIRPPKSVGTVITHLKSLMDVRAGLELSGSKAAKAIVAKQIDAKDAELVASDAYWKKDDAAKIECVKEMRAQIRKDLGLSEIE